MSCIVEVKTTNWEWAGHFDLRASVRAMNELAAASGEHAPMLRGHIYLSEVAPNSGVSHKTLEPSHFKLAS